MDNEKSKKPDTKKRPKANWADFRIKVKKSKPKSWKADGLGSLPTTACLF